jgi:hypothetical protein
MMALADAETHQILGAAILGTGGDEVIHGILDAMNARIPFTVLQRAVPIHPTVSELIPTLLGEISVTDWQVIHWRVGLRVIDRRGVCWYDV